ncbi:MAG: hypothetical protein FJ134_09185 [Deltaproteobacteria bacterium]|nr:hypothetical protein [Deltaproteobacteria bacterium]
MAPLSGGGCSSGGTSSSSGGVSSGVSSASSGGSVSGSGWGWAVGIPRLPLTMGIAGAGLLVAPGAWTSSPGSILVMCRVPCSSVYFLILASALLLRKITRASNTAAAKIFRTII